MSIELTEPPGGDRRPNGPEYDAITNIHWEVAAGPDGIAGMAEIDFVRRIVGPKIYLVDLAISLAAENAPSLEKVKLIRAKLEGGA